MCIAGQHGNRTQQHLVPPRQCHSEHCLNTQRDPDRRHTEKTSTIIIMTMCHSIMVNKGKVLTPSPDALGNRFSSGTSTSSMRIMPVAEALSENLPSILGVLKPFMPRSRMNPRTLPSSHLAQTTQMSATGEFVILYGGVGGGWRFGVNAE